MMMTEPLSDTVLILEKIKLLGTRLDKLSEEIAYVKRMAMSGEDILFDQNHLRTKALQRAFERINLLEEKVFPNLTRDLNQIRSVIGEDNDKDHNPLDERPRK